MIVVRKDLKMRRGKECSSAGHASSTWAIRKLLSGNTKLSKEQEDWLSTGTTKICVQVNSEVELLDIYNKAKAAGLEAHLVTDAGKTEFNGVPTKTCCAIGPNEASKIDKVTGHLSLY